MLMGRFLLQIYIFPRHKQNICCFFIYFYLRFIIKIQMQAFTIMCIYSGFLVPISSDRNKRYHASAPRGTIRTRQRYHWGDISVFILVNGLQTLHLKQSERIYVLQLVGIRLKLTRRLFLISAVCYNNLNISQIRLFTM